MYCRVVTFESAEHLIRITKLADYYIALPVLSRVLDETLVRNRSRGLTTDIHANALNLLPAACKLRYASLLRDCMCLLMGPWNSPLCHLIKDPGLKRFSGDVCLLRVRKVVEDCQRGLKKELQQRFAVPPGGWGRITESEWQVIGNEVRQKSMVLRWGQPEGQGTPHFSLPQYFYQLAEHRTTSYRLTNLIWTTVGSKQIVLDESGSYAGNHKYSQTWI